MVEFLWEQAWFFSSPACLLETYSYRDQLTTSLSEFSRGNSWNLFTPHFLHFRSRHLISWNWLPSGFGDNVFSWYLERIFSTCILAIALRFSTKWVLYISCSYCANRLAFSDNLNNVVSREKFILPHLKYTHLKNRSITGRLIDRNLWNITLFYSQTQIYLYRVEN